MIQIRLLGPPEIVTANGAAPAFVTAKAAGLFYYLITEQGSHSRPALAHLFWRDMVESTARVNLSKALSNLRAQLGDYVTISTQTIAFAHERPYWLDLEHFQWEREHQPAASSPQELLRRAQLYRGDFLDGFTVRAAPEFERWMLAQRDRLRSVAVQTFAALATGHGAQEDYAKAIHFWRRLLALERWHEDAHYELMKLLVLSGDPLAALKQYEQCRLALADELDVAPSLEITSLYEQIRASGGSAGARESTAKMFHLPARLADPDGEAGIPHNLPNLPTEFVGREQEVATILARLQEPGCRLLTLVGPGGIGKTRLALYVAQQLACFQPDTLFSDGVFSVSLMPVETAAGAISAIAEAIGFSFYSNVPPKQQLFDYLEQRKLLLILDNFEHLTKDAVLLAELLATASHLKILVTSRASVPLQWAYFHPVRGLTYPTIDHPDQGQGETDAVLLFTRLAQRQQATFSASVYRERIIRICQLVDGFPLALELAAAWIKVLPCSQIVHELETGLDVLSTELVDVAHRHRSMRTVFAQTWQILPAAEQAILQELAVFRGGFTFAAAAQVANASRHHLVSLVEKVLIQPEESGRYQMHELLRQFAREKLSTDEEREQAACTAHARFFLQMLAMPQPDKTGSEQEDETAALQADIDNIRTAWIWAAHHSEYAILDHALDRLYEFYYVQGRYSEGQEVLAECLASVRSTLHDHKMEFSSNIVNRLLVRKVFFEYLLGQHQPTIHSLHAALEVARAAEEQRECAFILDILGQIASWQSEQSNAATYLEESLALYQTLDEPLDCARVHFMLAEMYSHAGHFRHGATHARHCVEIGTQLGRDDLVGNGLTTLGFAYFGLGQYEKSFENYQNGRRSFEKTKDRLGYALATGGVGHALWQLEPDNLSQYAALIHLSLDICREIGHRLHTATRLFIVAQVHIQSGCYEQSIACAEECVRLATKGGYRLVFIGALWLLGECCCAMGDFAASRRHIRQALHLSLEFGIHHHLGHITTCYAVLLEKEADLLDPIAATANRVDAVRLATAALTHPGWHVSRRQAEQLLERQKAALPAEQFSAAQVQAKSQTLEAIMSELLRGA